MTVLLGIFFVVLMCAVLVAGVYMTLIIGGMLLAWLAANGERVGTRVDLEVPADYYK